MYFYHFNTVGWTLFDTYFTTWAFIEVNSMREILSSNDCIKRASIKTNCATNTIIFIYVCYLSCCHFTLEPFFIFSLNSNTIILPSESAASTMPDDVPNFISFGFKFSTTKVFFPTKSSVL